MTWAFIPRLPTAYAYANMPFQNHNTLKSVMKELVDAHKKNKMVIRGQLVFKVEDRDDVRDPNGLPLGTEKSFFEGLLYISYNTTRELHEFLDAVKWDDDKRIISVVIYDYGKFLRQK